MKCGQSADNVKEKNVNRQLLIALMFWFVCLFVCLIEL